MTLIVVHMLGAGMTPDMPVTMAIAVFGAVLSLVLPARYAIIPLAVVICAYPSELLIPPPEMQLTAARVVGGVLLLRCIFSTPIRSQFRWQWADTGAGIYYILMFAAQILTAKSAGEAINNRLGFFLSALVPYWCVRFLVIDRQRFYIVLKTFVWTAMPLAVLGLVQMITSHDPYEAVMQYGAHWQPISRMMIMTRPLLGMDFYRANGPFMQCIMYGWFFAIWVTPATNLFFEKRSLFPWIVPWLMLPLGAISTISAGPMTMAAITVAILFLFPLRRYWKIGVAGIVGLYVAFTFLSHRSAMEIVANFGFDQSSSWYRVSLIKYTLHTAVMNNHWWAGYGQIPDWWLWHDLCIQWVYLIVIYGIMGVVGFYGFVAAVGWMLWKGKQRCGEGIENQWLLWSLMAALVGSMLGMLLVSLFAEMFNLYHLFLGLVANAYLMVGQSTQADRHVGVMAEIEGRPVLLRYRLKQGQKLAVFAPAPAAPPPPVPVAPPTPDGTNAASH